MEITRKDKWALFNYLRPGYGWGFAALFTFLCVYWAWSETDTFLWPFIPLGILMAYTPIHDSVKTLFWIRKAAKEYILHEIVHDFYHAIPFDDERLRLGDKYLFGHRGSMLPLTYGEINGLFIHAEYQNSIDPRRYLFVQTNSSDSSRFCEIYGDGWTDEELELFLYIIHTKNPRTSWHMKPITPVYPTLLAKKYGLKE